MYQIAFKREIKPNHPPLLQKSLLWEKLKEEVKLCREKEGDLKEQTSVLFFRFYIESISFLKDKTTVELFFLNAKSCVHKVRALFWSVTDSRET